MRGWLRSNAVCYTPHHADEAAEGDDVAQHAWSGSEGMERLLAETRRALRAVRREPAADGDEPASGTGNACDGRIHVVVQAPGKVTALDLDPRIMRLPSQELSSEIMVAVNAALDDLRRTAVDATVPADPAVLGNQLEELQQESIRQMERFTSAINGAIAQIRTRRG